MSEVGRKTFRVSTKAAIYSEDGLRVIIMDLIDHDGKASVGLPGGHVEHGETPDEAMVRELEEELSIKVNNLTRVDFFVHPLGKLILAYTARASDTQEIKPESDWCKGRWVTRAEFEQLDTGVYQDFTLAHWPVNG